MPKLTSLTILDYSDKELLAIIEDLADEEGWADTGDIAVALGLDADAPSQNLGVRFGWMKRYGVVEHHPKASRSAWRVTPDGEVFLNGNLKAAIQRQLDSLEPGQLFTLTRFLGSRQRASDDHTRAMLYREYRHTTGLRR